MYYFDPGIRHVHLIIFYRNFMKQSYCHVGLGVNALLTLQVLRNHQIRTDALGVWTIKDVEDQLSRHPTVTHCLIEAPWIATSDMAEILHRYPHVHFIMRVHSQVGFLQVEPGAVKIIRESLVLQEGQPNFTVASNTRKLCAFVKTAYHSHVLYLPNLYNLERIAHRRDDVHHHRVVRIGSFGALRLMKNHTTAAAAALMVARELGKDLEFWISVDREEHGKSVLATLRTMLGGLPWAKLVENKWQSWPEFRQTVSHMDLCMQPSMTETFNIVTADAAAEGVPSVVSPSIEWVPPTWKADIDDIEDMTRKAHYLLMSQGNDEFGRAALHKYVKDSTVIWIEYLSHNPSQMTA